MNFKYKIVEDERYGYLRVDPIPTEEEVLQYYAREFYAERPQNFNDSSLTVQQEEKEFFYNRWESILNQCQAHFGRVENLSIFDIGFGYAQALLYFKAKGLEASGLEPSPEGVDYARRQGLNVFQSGIEEFSCVKEKRYDVVTLLNVLEHLRDPAQTLCNIKKQLLKKDGLLVIDVPNEFNAFQTVANQEYGLGEWWVSPPSHINYFSATSLKKLLIECGYSIIHAEASFPLEIFMLLGDVYVGNNELGKRCHEKRVLFESLLRKHGKQNVLVDFYKSLAELNLGRQIVMFATQQSGKDERKNGVF